VPGPPDQVARGDDREGYRIPGFCHVDQVLTRVKREWRITRLCHVSSRRVHFLSQWTFINSPNAKSRAMGR
jgi:hypothetical protein